MGVLRVKWDFSRRKYKKGQKEPQSKIELK